MQMSESNPIKQFEANPTSKAYAIKAKCAQCFGCTEDYLEPGFRHSISSCMSYSCPLHGLRPFQPDKGLTSQKIAT